MDNEHNFQFGISFEELYTLDGLAIVNQKFDEFLKIKDQKIYDEFFALKSNPSSFAKAQTSEILIKTSRILEDFLATLFGVSKENDALKKKHDDLHKIYVARREFVQRQVAKKSSSITENVDGSKILANLEISYSNIDEQEIKLAERILSLLWEISSLNEKQQKDLEDLTSYSCWALYSEEGRKLHQTGALFILPSKVNHEKLFEFESKNTNESEVKTYSSVAISTRNNSQNNFDLTDAGHGLNRALAEAHYCIFCHKQGKDSCRAGLKEKEVFKADPLNVELHGCPLDQKISEMNKLKSEGLSLAALSIAIIDNPLIAGTGHRICNDCMKSCIFQKQDPVDVPQIETKTLKDVLSLPYGFEIYSLLTRWNPLNLENPLPKKPSGKKILVAGLGPAGYTLSHYLLNDGHTVVAIDGLKIEPLNPELSGIYQFGNRTKFRPIKFLDEIYEPLSSRTIGGFGGVAEYGITSRWDKNFLKIIRLLLERRENFRMFGGIRFGSSITDKIAFETYSFDHVALCIGAGKPNIIPFKNNFAKGVRLASDFLMGLHLSGAYKKNLLSNLQIRMPILVVGGGLTATDVACEAQAYYLAQIEIFSDRHRELVKVLDEEKILSWLNEEEKAIANEFLSHFKELTTFKESGGNVSELLKKWGGSKIVYRKKIQNSPAYQFNHAELAKAFEQGIELIEEVNPIEAITDRFGAIEALKVINSLAKEEILPCKTLLVAAGTSPNLSPAVADKLDFALDGKYFAAVDGGGNRFETNHSAKPEQFSVLTKIDPITKKSVSFFGDLHTNFGGSVVKAMTSAKRGYKQINSILSALPNETNCSIQNFFSRINQEFSVRVESINSHSSHVVELVVKAPLAANQTQLGHIFRLQNYHSFAQKIGEQVMNMEGVAVTALAVDRTKGLITFIIVEAGGSTGLIKNLKVGEPLILMGPSGQPTEVAKNENVILVSGGRGNLPLVAIAKAYRENGCKVISFVGYLRNNYVTRQSEIEKNSDQVIFAIKDEEVDVKLTRTQDLQFKGSVTEAMISFLSKNNEKLIFNPSEVDRIFAMGNDSMMAEVARLRHDELKEVLNPKHFTITSLNAPMQCMMKGVCAQCLQKRFNEEIGKWEYFYSCAEQDQKMDQLDFDHLKQRCGQNSLAEKISKIWISHLKQTF